MFPDIAAIIQAGILNPWMYIPAALLLGALHALEPGHSKSLMAAFIVTVHGTARQAVLLGTSAAIGHTIVVWALAMLGLYLGDALIIDRAGPWLTLISGLLVMALAFRIYWMLRVPHNHSHDADGHEHHHDHDHDHHDHPHAHETKDAHALAHERAIEQNFKGRKVTNFDIAWFGFTGGLLPCPAAIAVLLVCIQLKKFALGVGLVAAFSIGLAITLVGIGVAAALGAQAASKRWAGFDNIAHKLPYFSAAIVSVIGLLITLQGLHQLGFI